MVDATSHTPGLIAIVGRPNVGKSALFNRIAGKRIAIVHNQPGVTRDRISAQAEWQGFPFTLVDTGGIGLGKNEKTPDLLARAALEQAVIAIESTQLILFVVNVQEGIVPSDREVAARLRESGKPVFVVVNKVDHGGMETDTVEFAELGFDRIFPVSAIHDLGIPELLDAAVRLLKPIQPAPSAPELGAHLPSAAPLKIAVVGRPNVGKSSLINALTRSKRVIVSPTPGTTRDAIDVPFEVETEGERQSYLLIDTAGIRLKKKIDTSIEFFSVQRAEDSIARCDLAIFVLDAEAGVTAHDKKIAGLIQERKKACVLVINKWDLVEPTLKERQKRDRRERDRHATKPPATLAEFGSWVQRQMFFLDFAPAIFTSALSGFHLDRLLEAIRYVAAQLRQTIPTAILNRTLRDAIERRQPVSAAGHPLKFFYAAQVQQIPPTFILFVNRHELFSPPYAKYLEGELRRSFGFEGCPIVLVAKARTKTIEPIRKKGAHRRSRVFPKNRN